MATAVYTVLLEVLEFTPLALPWLSTLYTSQSYMKLYINVCMALLYIKAIHSLLLCYYCFTSK